MRATSNIIGFACTHTFCRKIAIKEKYVDFFFTAACPDLPGVIYLNGGEDSAGPPGRPAL